MADYKLRRTHGKSRNGCLRCKQQRKKCDELQPSCSRCANRSYTCEYRSPRFACPGDHISTCDSSSRDVSPTSLCLSPTVNINSKTSLLNPDFPGPLDATELDLLSHYMMHTSQSIPFDHLDHYALSVGMPNIAFRSRPVMSSLIALAAACRCHDLVKLNSSLNEQTIKKVRELLILADSHHRSSLKHIQVAVSYSDCFDKILANAALMVLYASASHSVRVHLATVAKRSGQKLPSEVLPQHLQWISFTRAAHMASTAILNGIMDSVPVVETKTNFPSPNIHTQRMPTPGINAENLLSPQDGPSECTKRLFVPLVASTYTQALKVLREKVESTVASLGSHSLLKSCLKSLSILEACALEALSTKMSDQKHDGCNLQPLLLKHIQKVSPWIGEYMVSVTSMRSPRALRRTIMSFLNKVPGDFLSLVQSTLDSTFAADGAGNIMTPDSLSDEVFLVNSTQLLAVEIFAHWLVLVILLDGVWWIGDIGQWELGQVVTCMRTRGFLHQSTNTTETWWPESMYCIKVELSPHLKEY